jgi:Flp pilus assembly protein TadG
VKTPIAGPGSLVRRGHRASPVTGGERGQAMVEVALTLPFLLIVLTAVFALGSTFNQYIQVMGAARDGARKGAASRSGNTCTQADALARSAAKASAPGLNLTNAQIAVTRTCVSNALRQGSDFTVTVNYPTSIAIFGRPVYGLTLSSSTTIRVD